MLERLLALDLVGFNKIDLEFDRGLVVFTGPSGAGKSVLMGSILSLIGLEKPAASLSEITLDKPTGLECEDFALEEELTLKLVKKEKVRYYLNDQTISKNRLKSLFEGHIKHLSVRDSSELNNLLELLDLHADRKQKGFSELKNEYRRRYGVYKQKLEALQRVQEDEKRVQELMEFARFEIDKIESIDPKPGEDAELMDIKHKLSKIDKIKEAIEKAEQIFELESAVYDAYAILEKDSSVFDEAMNQLRNDFESSNDMIDELSDTDVEEVLDRIEQISELKRRFGSVEESLEYLQQKKKELAEYENLSFTKKDLESFVQSEGKALEKSAAQLTEYRKKSAAAVEKELNGYLKALRLTPVKFLFGAKSIDESGADTLDLDLKGSTIKTLSGGEFNRVRLALLVVRSALSEQNGVIILDEIDANVSGDESIAIAEMIKKLSTKYQIFAISHQPHVSAAAAQHFLVHKNSKGQSRVTELQGQSRVEEIARIVGGENPSEEAVSFAKKVLQ